MCFDANEDPVEVLKVQLQEFTELVVDGNDGGSVTDMICLGFKLCESILSKHDDDVSTEMSAQLSRISHSLSVIFPGRPDELIGQTVIKLHVDTPLSPELHVKVWTDDDS